MEAFSELISPIQDKLFRFAVRIVGSVDEAEDVVQEVFIKLWKKRDYLDQIDNVEAWCMQLTKNLSIDKLRSKHRRTEDINGYQELQDKQVTPDQQAIHTDLYDQIKSMIDQLPENQKMVVQLRDIEGLKYQEIADVLEMPLNQVKVNLFRARNTLKKQIIKLKAYGKA